MKNKNILEVCLSPDLGGLEIFVANCYREFSHKGKCKVVVAKGGKLDNYLDTQEKFYIKRNKLLPILPAKKLAKYIDENKIDIIHFHWTKDIIITVLAKLLSKRKPKLIQSRHMRMTRFKDDFYHRWLYKNIDLIHAVTYAVKVQLEKFIPQEIRPKIEMIYLGVDKPEIDEEKVKRLREQYKLQNNFVIGIVGRIEKGKGQHLVIDALARLNNDSKALIIGSAMNEEYFLQIRKQISDLNLEDRVILTGFTKDINEHMNLCDVVVLATENETFGLVVIEAMINQRAVIVTNQGGPLEIIDDGIDGLFFDGTAIDLLEKLLLITDKEYLEKLAQEGFKKVQSKFDKKIQNSKLYYEITS